MNPLFQCPSLVTRAFVALVFLLSTIQTGCSLLVDGEGELALVSISPTSGVVEGGTVVTITGGIFAAGSTVTIGGVACSSLNVDSSSQITCTTGAHAVGAVDVVLTNAEGKTATLAGAFTYEPAAGSPPTVTSISPTSGSTNGSTAITINGSAFAPGSTVTVGGVPCASVVVASTLRITCLTPAREAEGAADVIVTNPDSQTGALAGAFTYIAPPEITTVTPNSGTTLGGTSVTISGRFFGSGATVTIGSVPCASMSVDFSSQITCVSPAHAAGVVDVVVTNSDGQSDTLASAFTFVEPPTVTSISPATGTTGGGTTVTITGTFFALSATVTLGGNPCTSAVVGSSTSITCVTPAHAAGAVSLVVTNANSGLSGSAAGAFTYIVSPAPAVTSISPASGPTAGNTLVTITGTGFLAGATAKVGGATCTSPTVVSVTTITCRTPAHVVGAADVRVTNTDAQSSTLSSGFTYIAPPVLLSVGPLQGPTTGGNTVTLSGTGFTSGATVMFGDSSCTSVNVLFPTLMTCTAPARPAGLVDVSVTNSDGQVSTLAGAYVYLVAPAVTSLTPASGTTGGGTVVTIAGTGFSQNATVTVGGTACASVTVSSSIEITCTTPAHAAGAVDVVVTNNNGLAGTASGAFTYVATAAPTLTSLSPAIGPTGGGATVTLTGTGFLNGMTVKMGGSSCTSVTVTATTTATCITPSHQAGAVDIVITNTDAQTASLSSGYTFFLAPTITSVAPLVGTTSGGTSVTIRGTGFRLGATVTFGILDCPVTVLFPTELTCTAPAHSAGFVDVLVTNLDGQSVLKDDGYLYTAAPTLTSISPASGPTSGGTTVTLTGTNFTPGITVTVGGVSCSSVSVVSPTSLTCTTGNHAVGAVDVVMTDSNALTASLVSGFTYIATPTVTSVSPASGTTAGGITITITGTIFLAGATVTVDGQACTSPTVVSSTEITCVVPAHSAGVVDIVVTNTAGPSGTGSGLYTYILAPAPTVTSISPASGPKAGSTFVTITGTGFLTNPTVTIGGLACSSTTLVSATSITCRTPAASAGTADVRVMNEDEQSGSLVNGYAFIAPPVVTSISPSVGSTAGGNTVTITGTGFLSGATVTMGSSACTSVNVLFPTQLTCETPAHAAGVVDINVTNSDGQTSQLSTAYAYLTPPIITGVSPASGTTGGGTSITVTGTSFSSDAVVTVAGSVCTPVSISSSTQIICRTPAHAAGAVDVVVTNASGVSGTSSGGYTYAVAAAPTVTSVSPAIGPTAGGATLTLTGTGFLAGMTIKVGGSTCTSPSVSTVTTATCVTPLHQAGTVDVVATNTDAQTGSLTNGYTYLLAPTVTQVTPPVGSTAGGNSIVVRGTGFRADSTVTLGVLDCPVTVAFPAALTCTAPAHSAGFVDVLVTNSDGQTFSLEDGYAYATPPTVTGIAPASGTTLGGSTVTITGTGYFPGVTASIGGNSCTSVSVSTPTTLTCVTPAHAAGAEDVVVADTNGVTGTLAGGYTFVTPTPNDPPVVTSLSPSSGPTAGGTPVTITGTDFLTGATVTVGGVACTSPVVVNSTTITCTTGAHVAGSGDVSVTNPDSQSDDLASGFTFIPPPVVTLITPSAGTTLGGTSVVITGTGFTIGATVEIGSTPCTNVSVDFSTQITCDTPAHSAGVVDVVVTNTDTQSGRLNSSYTYLAPPTFTSITPATGTTGGGTPVTIAGTAFLAGATVTIGGSPCTNVTVGSSTEITCTTPSHAAGAVAVVITNTNGLSATSAGAYTYALAAAPTVTSISPASGPTTGGASVTITGTGFLAGATVKVGGLSCTSVNVSAATTITCLTPAHAVGASDIRVINTDEQVGSLNSAYTFVAPPTISSVGPSLGSTAGGNTLTINGTGFSAGATVEMGSTACGGVSIPFPTQITCVVPAHAAGVVDITVTNSDGQTTTLENGYTYVDAPTVTAILPVSGTTGGGTSVTITGTGFSSTTTVTIGGSTCTEPTASSSTTLVCKTPAHAAGATDVIATNANGTTGTASGAYTFVATAAPTVSSISPASGAVAGGTAVTITGTGFLAGAAVTIGGVSCTSATVVAATTITCTTSLHSAGVVDIVVANTDAQEGTLANGYTYLAPPTITSLSPAAGSTAGGNSVVITGTGFRTGVTVELGILDCPVTLDFADQITCTAPAHSAGFVSVSVTNIDGQTATSSGAYLYATPPAVASIAPTSGRSSGGTAVTLTGTNFTLGSTVTIGGSNCTGVTVVSPTSITCTTTAHAGGASDVVVTGTNLVSGTLSNGFTYVPPPTVTSVSPTNGTKDGNTALTITGTGFILGATVTIGGTACTAVSVDSDTEITCTSPAHAVGLVDVVVTNTDSQSGTGTGVYTYVDIDFNVTVTSVTNADMFLHAEGDWTEECKIPSGSTGEDIRCVLEADEGDLYMLGYQLNYNFPGLMCRYAKFQPYFFLQREAGFGPSAVTLTEDGSGNISIVSQTPSAFSPNAVAVIENNALVCSLDDTCEGPYTLTDQNGIVTEEAWPGSIANALVGPAMDTQQIYASSGFPKPDLRFLGGTTLSSTYTVAAPKDKDHRSNAYAANWFSGDPDYLFASAPLPMRAIPWHTVPLHNMSPWFQFDCLDNAHETINRIRLVTRSWSTDAQFELELAGNPSVATPEGLPFDDELNLDYRVWPSAGGGFDDTYPQSDL